MQYFNFRKFLSGANQSDSSPLWLPVIEIYKEFLSDGTIRLSAEKAVWIERSAGNYERCGWDADLGNIIDAFVAFYGPSMSEAFRQIIKHLPKPYIKTISAEYLPYTAFDWQKICGEINRVDELISSLNWLTMLSAEERRFFDEAVSGERSTNDR